MEWVVWEKITKGRGGPQLVIWPVVDLEGRNSFIERET
jgi:hypothetical protein